jgi:hypothetical protein
MLAQWGGYFRFLCLLRLPTENSTTLTVHAFKVPWLLAVLYACTCTLSCVYVLRVVPLHSAVCHFAPSPFQGAFI